MILQWNWNTLLKYRICESRQIRASQKLRGRFLQIPYIKENILYCLNLNIQIMKKILWKLNSFSLVLSFSFWSFPKIHLKTIKKSLKCEEGGAHLRISFYHLLMNFKNK